jgi:uncharacterized repeat protein (TIGR01451 family)
MKFRLPLIAVLAAGAAVIGFALVAGPASALPPRPIYDPIREPIIGCEPTKLYLVALPKVQGTTRVGSTVTFDAGSPRLERGLRNCTHDTYPVPSFRWEIATKPAGSAASLTAASSLSPNLRLDVAGEYRVRFVACPSGCTVQLRGGATEAVSRTTKDVVFQAFGRPIPPIGPIGPIEPINPDPPTPVMDLDLAMDASPSPVDFDATVTYTLGVRNLGPAAAASVEVEDALPAGAILVSKQATRQNANSLACIGLRTISCPIGNLASGESARVTIVVRVTGSEPLLNQAEVRGSGFELNRTNNIATAMTPVVPAFDGSSPSDPSLPEDPFFGGEGAAGGESSAGAENPRTRSGRASSRCTISGTPGRDVLRGTPGRDVICGLGGNDVLRGLAGDDVLRGGAGKDRLVGGKGSDVMQGGAGRDVLLARDRIRDVVLGGKGTDRAKFDKRDRVRLVERAL